MAKPDLILLALETPATWQMFERVLRQAGFEIAVAQDNKSLEKSLLSSTPSLVILAEKLGEDDGLTLAVLLLERFPTLPILLLADQGTPSILEKAINAGLYGCLVPPLKTDALVSKVRKSLDRARRTGDWVRREVKRTTSSLEEQVDALEHLLKLGREITGSLEIDQVLANVVADAIALSQAYEGSLMLLSADKQRLHIRAGQIFEQNSDSLQQLPLDGTFAGQVVRQGQALSINLAIPNLGNSLAGQQTIAYVPLVAKGSVVGVLGVSDPQRVQPFSDAQLRLLSVLADYAVIAIENARLFTESEGERQKFSSVFASIDSGVIILDMQSKIMFANHAVCRFFKLNQTELAGRPLSIAIPHPDVSNLIERIAESPIKYHEINLDDGQTLNAQHTLIPGIGSAITMQDVTHLKELDRLKSDFVHTVSHDLRSPLTAVMGYAELLERVGPLNPQQRDFVRHIQSGVQNITGLINDLLDLGRIEAGFDTRKEVTNLLIVLKTSADSMRGMAFRKSIQLTITVPDELPAMRGNPIRLRQMLDNLIGNAIKYTPENGRVNTSLSAEDNQIILQVSDTGPGIPPQEQAHIFDKFYRASNVPSGTPGTGLGLAIVKSIVENHLGRIWVASTLGEGTTFTVVLPAMAETTPSNAAQLP